MQPGVELLDEHDLLTDVLHRPAWHADAASRGQDHALFVERGGDVDPALAVVPGPGSKGRKSETRKRRERREERGERREETGEPRFLDLRQIQNAHRPAIP